MFIVHVAAELAPLAKVGGLGDIIYGLSKELIREKHSVEIIIPKYDTIHYSLLHDLKITEFGKTRIWSASFENLSIKLIENNTLFYRGAIYGLSDDLERFQYFCEATMTYLLHMPQRPDVIHLHDWHTALLAPLKKKYASLDHTKSVLTMHNLQYQGQCSPSFFANMGINNDPPSQSLLEIGIREADAVTTVSPTYEREIKTPEFGFGLDPLLNEYAFKLTGILNGIDQEFWNPETDPYIYSQYATHPIEDLVKGKQKNRSFLRKTLGLKDDQTPLIAAVTRLVSQKGPELIKHALLRTADQSGQFVLLGASGTPETVDDFIQLKTKYKNSGLVSISLEQDEALAHLIFAAADGLIIPSHFEPCGLTQLIAMRYGTIPIVRRTGGLADTVFDCDASDVPHQQRNGFTFDFPDFEGVNWALDRALLYYRNKQEKWKTLIKNGIAVDCSWKKSVHQYLQIYKK